MKRIEKLVVAYGEAMFECGEWNRDESEESYDAVHRRAQIAADKLLAAIKEDSSR